MEGDEEQGRGFEIKEGEGGDEGMRRIGVREKKRSVCNVVD